MFEKLTGVISLLNSGVGLVKNTMDAITSVKTAFKPNSANKVESNIYYINQQEVYDTSKEKQSVISKTSNLIQAVAPLQKQVGRDILMTQPILTPDKFKSAMTTDPKDLLFNIMSLNDWKRTSQMIEDPTLIPIVFPDANNQYIGWIKKGYARDFLSLDYKPQIIPLERKISQSVLTQRESTLLETSAIQLVNSSVRITNNTVRESDMKWTCEFEVTDLESVDFDMILFLGGIAKNWCIHVKPERAFQKLMATTYVPVKCSGAAGMKMPTKVELYYHDTSIPLDIELHFSTVDFY